MLNITTPAGISRASIAMRQAGDTWHGPLFRAAMVGDLNVGIVVPGDRTPDRFLEADTAVKPVVLILGGDGKRGAGPDEFPNLWRPMKWARAILLHGAGGEEFHYEEVVRAAQLVRRVLVVETSSDKLPAWAEERIRLAPGTSTLVIATRPGVVHPAPPEGGGHG